MITNPHPGKFIVFEGIDGSGKSTQTKLLIKSFKKEGYKVAFIDFPQHGQKSAGLVDEYLVGKYGTVNKVSPYQASIFYACDRYAASFKIRDWLKKGRIVIADRYIGSNIGHQGSKIKSIKERKKFFKWLYNLEYKIFKIPKPNLNLILKVPPRIGQSLLGKITDQNKKTKKKIYLGERKSDIHEKNLVHLINTEKAYLHVAKEFPKDFKIIECFRNGKLLPPEIVHQEIWKIVKKTVLK